MRNFVFRLAALAGVLFALGACADSPTQSDQQRATDLAAPVQDKQVTPQGCVADGGVCLLPPERGGWCDPYEELDFSCEDDDQCMTSVGDPTDVTVQGCPGDGGGTPPPGGDTGGGDPGTTTPPDTTGEPVCEIDCPAEEEEFDTDICPQPLRGKTVTALIPVAGRNHEFQFTGRMDRVNPLMGRSPAWYKISGPTVSEDNWWIAQDGTIQLVCWGRWRFRNTLWVGRVYLQASDLHMVMAPGHPDFGSQPPYPPTDPSYPPTYPTGAP